MSREEFEAAFGGDFSDFFAHMFGQQFGEQFQGRTRRHPRYSYRGADVRADLQIPLRDALRGGKSSFEFPTTAPCTRCGGVGFVADHVCPACTGVGSTHDRRRIDLQIPEDVRDGMVLRLRGLGQPGDAGGEAGDLLLTLHLGSDDAHRRDGSDVIVDVPVAPWDCLAGTTVAVRTAHADVDVRIPPDTKAGTRLRVKGHGLSDGQGGRGDFYVLVRMALPDNLTDRQRQLLQEAGR